MILNEISIGTQTWTSENISIGNFINGDPIKESKNQEELSFANKHKIPTWHLKDFDTENAHHGNFYNYYAITDPRNISPEGWKIPNRSDWDDLFSYCGYLNETEMTYLKQSQFDFFNLRAITSLKSKKSWSAGKHKGNNSSGFNALSDKDGKHSAWVVKDNKKLELLMMGSRLRSPISKQFQFFNQDETSSLRLIKLNSSNEWTSQNEYVKIGNLEWMTTNICNEKFNNGDAIPIVQNNDEWLKFGKEKKPACCYYDNNLNNKKFGLLYNYYALIDKRGIIPSGYRAANINDWMELKKEIGKEPQAFLKLMNSKLWNRVFSSGGRAIGTNLVKFNVIPTGIRRLIYITTWEGESIYQSCFGNKGDDAYWWTEDGFSVHLGYSNDNNLDSVYPEFEFENLQKTHNDYLMSGLSVRCIRTV
jgi:uncharacterized protein (TIGR02145 family)